MPAQFAKLLERLSKGFGNRALFFPPFFYLENILANVVFDKNFVKSVENFVFKNEKKYSAEIAKQKANIPAMFRTGGVFYRGMVLQDVETLTLSDISSWTTDLKMATRFATDASKRVKDTPGQAYIFKKNIPANKVILNIANYVGFLNNSFALDQFNFDESTLEMALEEAEVLVEKGIKLVKSDIYKIIK